MATWRNEIVALSAEIGSNPLLVQGAGGNISIKQDGLLWIKASGTWLADAETRDLFVPTDLAVLRSGIATRLADPVGPAHRDGGPTGLRPSIETSLHALLPHRVVVHVHSVATIALAVRDDGQAVFGRALHGLRWHWIPYHKPGPTLTQVVARALEDGAADILVLENHGLVVGAPSAAAARALVAEIEGRIGGPPRPAGVPDPARLRALADASPFRLPRHEAVHGIAIDPLSLCRAYQGSLYPDHVVFLGPGATVVEPDRFQPACADWRSREHLPPALLLVPGLGALVRRDIDAGAEEMALCLALVLERIPDHMTLKYLRPQDEAELIGWDAERYRRTLVRPPSP
ncbi:MAG TPA: class II aldolase/adducin family protein [Stellaceae bacterium]|nr:class II aldolase/adducin family protein [Stellaceae bacterium]